MKRLLLILLSAIASLTLSAQVASPYAQVNGRIPMGILEKPSYDGHKEGVVIVSVWIDQYGAVTKVQAGAPGTTLLDPAAWESARNAALKIHFNQSADAPSLQEGTISYFFSNNQSGSTKAEAEPGASQQADSPKYAKLYFTYSTIDSESLVSRWKMDSVEFFDENGKIERLTKNFGGKSTETITLNKILDRGYKVVDTNTSVSVLRDWIYMVVDYLLEKN